MLRKRVIQNPLGHLLVWLSILLLTGMREAEAQEFVRGVDGDIGLGGYYTRSIIRGKSDELNVLPYLDFDYGRMFVRVDIGTLKMTPLGAFMINLFHDINPSQGDLFEVIYGGEFNLPRVTFYPLSLVQDTWIQVTCPSVTDSGKRRTLTRSGCREHLPKRHRKPTHRGN